MRILISFLCLVVIWAEACLASPAEISESDEARLMRGEILVETVHEEKSGGAAEVRAMFHTDIDTVWEVVGYCEKEFIYVRGLEYCEILKIESDTVRKRHRVNNNWYTPTIDFVFEASKDSMGQGTFRLIEGNMKVMEGKWGFEPAGDGLILATHEIRVRSNFPAPRWLVRRVLKKDLPNMMACVRGLADASGDSKSVAIDLERCPGETTQGK